MQGREIGGGPAQGSPLALATALVGKWEGFAQVPRRNGAGVWVVGYGFSTVDGAPVGPQTPRMSQVEAQARLGQRVETAMWEVRRLTKGSHLGPWQTIAMTDFVYNLGSRALHGSSLRRFILEGSPRKAAEEFEKHLMLRGAEGLLVAVEDLRPRRKEERSLFVRDIKGFTP